MKYLMGFLAVTLSAAVLAGEKVDKALEVQADGNINIEIVKGDVVIEAWNKSMIQVVGELDENTEKFVFETSGKETLIQVKVKEGIFSNRNGRGSRLKIQVPEKSSIRAEGVSTDFKIRGVKGGVDLETVSGDFNLSEIEKLIDIDSVSGDVKIVASKGDLSVEVVSGDIVADIRSDDVKVESVSGDVNLVLGKTKKLDIATVSGDVAVDFELLAKGKANLATVSGDVVLKFMGEVNASFDFETGPGGDIKDRLTGGKVESLGGARMKTKIGDGSAGVGVSTMSGTITISK